MAKHFYENIAGGEDLKLIADPAAFNVNLDTTRLDVISQFQALDAEAREVAASCKTMTLVEYDDALEQEEWTIRDRLDYYTLYVNRTQELTVRDGAWFSPVTVDSFCGEEVGQEASKSVDGNNATFWRHSSNEQHIIIFQLRNYPKKISKIRFRYGAGESARERLNNMDVHAAKATNNLDNPENILETGINISWPVAAGEVWVEHTLASKKNKARYVKLVIDDTDNAGNQIQIREFEVWVETVDPES